MPRAVVLLSGGLDSATVAAIARSQGFEWFGLSVDYGQRHRFELEASRKVAKALGARDHIQVDVDLSRIGGSALTADIAVPKDRDESTMSTGIPVTYVPARNTVLLSLALGYAEVLGAGDCVPGVLPAADPPEVVLRVAVRDPRKAAVERFTKEFAPLVTSGFAGTTGYTTGRPPVREVFAYWPALLLKSAVVPRVEIV